jgi:nucleotide-binding universal stress UspA family protein
VTHPVVVGVDDAPGMGETVDWAADEAQLRGGRLHLVHAWLPQPYDTPDAVDNARSRQAAERLVSGLAARAAELQPALEVTREVVEAGPRDALLTLSRTAGLLVVGRRGAGGFPGLLVGSTGLYLAGCAACPVVVVPPAPEEVSPSEGAVGGIAVGLRGREAADEVLAFAFDSAQRRGLPLRVLHAWRTPLIELGRVLPPVYEEGHVAGERERLVAEIMAGWRLRYPDVPVHVDVVRTGAAKHLVEWSATEHLLVVGRHGDGDGPVRRLGSVSQAAVHYARCPVAVVPVG